jgi:ribosome-interacting GTPase 1
MVNYSNGKIYKIEPIVEHLEGEIYIGSTTKKYLSQRMDKHRSSYKLWKDGKTNKTTVFDLFDKYGIDNCKIYLLESVNANTKDELLSREGHYIRTLKCVNRCVAGRTRKESNEHYYNDNKNKILQNKKQICHCNVCNCNYTKSNKLHHEKTRKHQNNLNIEK